MNSLPIPCRALLTGTLLAVLLPRAARAEDAISYKYEDYREMGGRVVIRTQGTYLEKDIGTDYHFKAQGILDSIAGATPTGQPAPTGSREVPLSHLQDERKAWNAELARQFPGINVAVGVGNSRESDYVSNGWSLNTVTDFNQKNTTLLLGVAGTEDKIRVFYQPTRARKHANDLIAGVTQLLSPSMSVTANLSWGRQTGYLADPYKVVEKGVEVIPGVVLPLTYAENRPGERDKWTLFVSTNRAFPGARAAAEASYRFYHDTYGTNAHTIDTAWFQRIGEKLIFRPGFRFYDQTAASFYRYRLDGTNLMPTVGAPRPQGPFYSSDYRLSAMQTFTYGAKLIWHGPAGLEFDAAFERYDMRGTDRVTPQSAYARANITTLGVKYAW
jgi:hypothetical protein